MDRRPSLSELEHEVSYYSSRIALYKARIYAGKADPDRMREMERQLSSARHRLKVFKETLS